MLVELLISLPAILQMLQHPLMSQFWLPGPNSFEDAYVKLEISFPGLIRGNLCPPFQKKIAKRNHDALQNRASGRLRDFIVKSNFAFQIFLQLSNSVFHLP